MTHTLHREGTAQSLSNDYVVVAKAAKGINDVGAKSKLIELISSAIEFGALNVGHGRGGNYLMTEDSITFNDLCDSVVDTSTITAVFDNYDKFFHFIAFLVENDSGLSITLSGLIDKTQSCCQQLGLRPNSLRQSLGIIGNKEKLATDKIREITTMCGHGLIASRLVEQKIEDIHQGVDNTEDSATQLSKLCLCGIFNSTRCVALMDEAVKTSNG